MTTFKTVAEIETALRDREEVQAVMAKVDKGKKGTFTYVPWNETARLLTKIFGTFGWSAKITSSFSDTTRGIYVVDLELEVKAVDDELGVILVKSLPGRGMGVVAASQLESADAHDTAGKAARSDSLSVAAKSLGDAFGLFLYDKGDPARTTTTSSDVATTQRQEAKTDTRAATPAPAAGGRIGNASEKQAGVLRREGWGDEQIAALSREEVSEKIGKILKGEKVAPPKTVSGSAQLHVVGKTGTADEF